MPGDICFEGTTADECALIGGTYLGDGLTCDADPDNDGAVGCDDGCPLDPKKTDPGVCGCGVPDDGADADMDGVPDCIDLCPDSFNEPVDENGCPTSGACCFFDVGVCVEETEPNDCTAAGGVHQGAGSTCAFGCAMPGDGDFDGDGDVELDDFAPWSECATGPIPTFLPEGCAALDFDGNHTVDQFDFAQFQQAFTGCTPCCPVCPGGEFSFTLNQDNLVGTTGDDMFDAPLLLNNGVPMASLQTGDSADGKDGVDELTASFAATNATNTVPTLINIETYTISDFGSATTTLKLFVASGVTTINNLDSVRTVTVTDIGTPANLGVINSDQGIAATYKPAATAGTADSVTLSLSGVTGGTATVTTDAASGFETATIESTGGAANTLDSFATAGNTLTLKTLNVTGDTSVKIGVVPNSLTTKIDASGLTGTAGVTLGTGTSADTYAAFSTADIASVIGSDGDDVIIFNDTFDSADFPGPMGLLNLGAGSDVVQASFSASLVAASPLRNVEEVRYHATLGGITVNFTGQTGLEVITIDADGTSNTLTLLDVPTTPADTSPALTFRGDAMQATQTYDTVTYVGVGTTGSNDVLEVNVGNRGTPLNAGPDTSNIHMIGGGPLTAAGYETLHITVSDGPAAFPGLAMPVLTYLIVSASSDLSLGNVFVGQQRLEGVNATGVAGDFIATLDGLTYAAQIVLGVGDDSLTIVGATPLIPGTPISTSLGDGDDTYVDATNNDTYDFLNAGPGDDTIAPADGDNQITTGTGADTVVYDQTPGDGETNVTDFAVGGGGDILRFDISAMGLAGGDVFVGPIGDLAPDSSDELVIITGTGYVSDEAVEDAIAEQITTDGFAMVILYFNTTDEHTHIVHDPNAGADGTNTVAPLGELTNLTTQADHDALTGANVGAQP